MITFLILEFHFVATHVDSLKMFEKNILFFRISKSYVLKDPPLIDKVHFVAFFVLYQQYYINTVSNLLRQHGETFKRNLAQGSRY